MRRLVLAALAALMLPAGAAAGDLTLHPVGHGEESYAHWDAKDGQVDSNGNAEQALYMQNTGRVFTAAAAHVLGIEGLRANLLVGLAYEHRVDSVCNRFSPRWAIFVQGRSGREYLANLGCATSPPTPAAPGWVRRSWPQAVIRTALLRAGGNDALAGTITRLALVYDRTRGFAYLDNIFARSRFGSQVWTYAGDNGDQSRVNPFSATEWELLAAAPTAYEEMTNDELLATLTDEEWALIREDADEVF